MALAATLGISSVLSGAVLAQLRLEPRPTGARAYDVPFVLLLTALLVFFLANFPSLAPAGVWWTLLLAYELVAGALVGHGAASALREVLAARRADGRNRGPGGVEQRPHVPFMYFTALCLLVPLWPVLVPIAPPGL